MYVFVFKNARVKPHKHSLFLFLISQVQNYKKHFILPNKNTKKVLSQ